MMAENFDPDGILKEILEVLQKYAIPVQSVGVDISLSTSDFEMIIPPLKNFKPGAGMFNKRVVMDNVPMRLSAQRRIPFAEIVAWLDAHIVPSTRQFADDLKRDFPELIIRFYAKYSEGTFNSALGENYDISIECAFSEAEHEDYNTLMLSVILRQNDATSYPQIDAFVGWLVDEESGGDWGLEVVARRLSHGQQVYPHILEMLERDIPYLYRDLHGAIEKRLNDSGELHD